VATINRPTANEQITVANTCTMAPIDGRAVDCPGSSSSRMSPTLFIAFPPSPGHWYCPDYPIRNDSTHFFQLRTATRRQSTPSRQPSVENIHVGKRVFAAARILAPLF